MIHEYEELALNAFANGQVPSELQPTIDFHTPIKIEISKQFLVQQPIGADLTFFATCSYDVVSEGSSLTVEDKQEYISNPCFPTDYPYSLFTIVNGCTIFLDIFSNLELKSHVQSALDYEIGLDLCNTFLLAKTA